MTATTIQLSALADVIQVYSGRANACCCGCSGKHTVASAHRAEAARRCGYAVADEDVSDRTVKLIYNKVAKAAEAGVEFICTGESNCWSVDVGSRTYCLYIA